MDSEAISRDEFESMVAKNIVCDECGESSFRIKSGVYSNHCRHCDNVIEDAWE